MKAITKISLIVPCFNESEVLKITIPLLLEYLQELIKNSICDKNSFILFIDDGSDDSTWKLIQEASQAYKGLVRGLKLSCNVGHQGAILSGLEYVSEKCDAAISIDADLQDDLNAIKKMLHEFENGAEIVLGVRISRHNDTWFKKTSANFFYKIIKLLGVDLVENHADFRLMSSKVLSSLKKFTEHNLFLRGFPKMLHKNIAIVGYERRERVAGKTKYPLAKMLSLAWNGVTSFSIIPLRLVLIAGVIIFIISLLLVFYALIGFISGNTLPGWLSIVLPLYFLGGMIMISIGIIGEYLGKLFFEVKRRPRFIVDAVIGE